MFSYNKNAFFPQEIDVLERRVADGSLQNPEKTQLEKIATRADFEREEKELVERLGEETIPAS